MMNGDEHMDEFKIGLLDPGFASESSVDYTSEMDDSDSEDVYIPDPWDFRRVEEEAMDEEFYGRLNVWSVVDQKRNHGIDTAVELRIVAARRGMDVMLNSASGFSDMYASCQLRGVVRVFVCSVRFHLAPAMYFSGFEFANAIYRDDLAELKQLLAEDTMKVLVHGLRHSCSADMKALGLLLVSKAVWYDAVKILTWLRTFTDPGETLEQLVRTITCGL